MEIGAGLHRAVLGLDRNGPVENLFGAHGGLRVYEGNIQEQLFRNVNFGSRNLHQYGGRFPELGVPFWPSL